MEALGTALLSRAAGEWERVLAAAAVGCAEVAAPATVGLGAELFLPGGLGDRLGLLVPVRHPIFDDHVRSAALVTLSRGVQTTGAVCEIGQHTDEVLREMLGLDQARIDALRATGVIGSEVR